MEEVLNLDSEFLKPIKDGLELSINVLTKNALLTKKEAEITLKINIGVEQRFKQEKKWLEPKIEYQINDKIKEAKSSYKNDIGYNYKIELDDDNNIIVQNLSEQTSLF